MRDEPFYWAYESPLLLIGRFCPDSLASMATGTFAQPVGEHVGHVGVDCSGPRCRPTVITSPVIRVQAVGQSGRELSGRLSGFGPLLFL